MGGCGPMLLRLHDYCPEDNQIADWLPFQPPSQGPPKDTGQRPEGAILPLESQTRKLRVSITANNAKMDRHQVLGSTTIWE